MSKEVPIHLPKLGESIVSATVVRWFKKVGDRVALDEPLLEVSTDKINSEIPSPVAGVLSAIKAAPDEEVAVGGLLALVSTDVSVAHSAPTEPEKTATVKKDELENDLLSPAVLRLLREKGIPLSDLGKIPATGQGGRLTRKDVENYSPAAPDSSSQDERVKMTPLRKAIAENMVRSFYQAPHASLITEVDVTDLVAYVQQKKEEFLKEHGTKLSITPFVAIAMAKAVEAYPLINSSLEEDTIVVKKGVNLGIAVSVDQGVMVPVIHGCHTLSLPEVAKRIASMAEKARNHTLSSEDVRGGTLTLTNFGMAGTMIGIPIIRYPEVAIVGMGAITKKAAVLPNGEIGPRSILWMSLTFDHRVLDGLYGCGFLSALKEQLEKFSQL